MSGTTIQRIRVSSETYSVLRRMCGSAVMYSGETESETAIVLHGVIESANVLVSPHGMENGPFETLFEKLAGYAPGRDRG